MTVREELSPLDAFAFLQISVSASGDLECPVAKISLICDWAPSQAYEPIFSRG